MREHKTYDVKPALEVNVETRTVEGYARLFNHVNQAGDVVLPGAFKDTLERRGVTALVWVSEPESPPLA